MLNSTLPTADRRIINKWITDLISLRFAFAGDNLSRTFCHREMQRGAQTQSDTNLLSFTSHETDPKSLGDRPPASEETG
jgi:hypothetical protein